MGSARCAWGGRRAVMRQLEAGGDSRSDRRASIVFKMTISLRMQATRATLASLPLARSRW